jgi:hypothetical protein
MPRHDVAEKRGLRVVLRRRRDHFRRAFPPSDGEGCCLPIREQSVISVLHAMPANVFDAANAT